MKHKPIITKTRINDPSSDYEDFHLEAKFIAKWKAKKDHLSKIEGYVNKKIIQEINYQIYGPIYDVLYEELKRTYDLFEEGVDCKQIIDLLELIKNSIPRITYN